MKIDFLIAKAEYLLNYSDDRVKGGDKQKYWRQVLGFNSADELRKAILAEISTDMLKPHGKHPMAIATLHQFKLIVLRGGRKQF